MKSAIVVTAVTTLIISGILVSAANIPCTALGSSSSSIAGDPTSSLQSAKMHLIEATKDINMTNLQAALKQINMANQAITLAGLKLNATIICNNMRNEGYCVAPSLQFLK